MSIYHTNLKMLKSKTAYNEIKKINKCLVVRFVITNIGTKTSKLSTNYKQTRFIIFAY